MDVYYDHQRAHHRGQLFREPLEVHRAPNRERVGVQVGGDIGDHQRGRQQGHFCRAPPGAHRGPGREHIGGQVGAGIGDPPGATLSRTLRGNYIENPWGRLGSNYIENPPGATISRTPGGTSGARSDVILLLSMVRIYAGGSGTLTYAETTIVCVGRRSKTLMKLFEGCLRRFL